MKKLLFILSSLFAVGCQAIDYITSFKVDLVFRNESSHTVTLELTGHEFSNELITIPAGEEYILVTGYAYDGRDLPMSESGYRSVVPYRAIVTFEGLEPVKHDHDTPNSTTLATSYEVVESDFQERYQKVKHTLTDADYEQAQIKIARREKTEMLDQIFEAVKEKAGEYNMHLAEEMLADKEWRGNTYAWYNDDWSEVIATGMVDGVYPPAPPGGEVGPINYDFYLLSNGDMSWGGYTSNGTADYTWELNPIARMLTFKRKGADESVEAYRVVALSDEWLILENDREHARLLFEGRSIE